MSKDLILQLEENSKQLKDKDLYYKNIIENLQSKLTDQEQFVQGHYQQVVRDYEMKERDANEKFKIISNKFEDEIASLKRFVYERFCE